MRRARQTPYVHIAGPDGSIYMERYWLFNPYRDTPGMRRFKWCPISVRVHHIRREDLDQHLRDHPWNARTFILMGGYVEEREDGVLRHMLPGMTASIRFGQFHRIEHVDPTFGAVTLFVTGKYRGKWGFKIPYDEYLAQR